MPGTAKQPIIKNLRQSADRKTTIAAEDGGAPRHNAAAKRSMQSSGATIQKSLRGCWTAQADFV